MTLTLEPQEVQVVINALAKEPWHVAHPVMSKLIEQVQKQQTYQTPEPVTK